MDRYKTGHKIPRTHEVILGITFEIYTTNCKPQVTLGPFQIFICNSRGYPSDGLWTRYRKIIRLNFKLKFNRNLRNHTEGSIGRRFGNVSKTDQVREGLVLIENDMGRGPFNFEEKFSGRLSTPKNFSSQFNVGLEGLMGRPGLAYARLSQKAYGRTELRKRVLAFLYGSVKVTIHGE